MRPLRWHERISIYLDYRDIWVGVFVAEHSIYVCPLPCVVLRWSR